MTLLRRERRSSGSPFPEPIVPPFPGVNIFGGGTNVTTQQALQSSAVWACVRLLSDAVSMMPLNEFTRKGDGPRRPLPPSPLLKRPAADATMADWIYMLMVSMLLRGNAYGRKVAWDAAGWPTQIELFHPDQVHVRKDTKTGQTVYTANGTKLDPDEVFHLPAFRFPGMTQGLSPIMYAATSIQTDSAIGDFAYGFFRDGAHPSAVLESPNQISEDQARTIKQRFMAAVKGREPVALGLGVTYKQIQIAPNESQFLETQKYGVAEISRIFGVPPEMIAAEAGNSMTYSNIEQRSLDFLVYSVQPWLNRIEQALMNLLPGQRHVRFDTSVLLRTDLETRAKASSILVASHQITPDESREIFHDLPPMTAAQKTESDLVPMTITPSGLPKATPAAAPAGEPSTAPPAKQQGAGE